MKKWNLYTDVGLDEYDIIGDRPDVIRSILYYYGLDELPENWELVEIREDVGSEIHTDNVSP